MMLEITGTFTGERYRFENVGPDVIIGGILDSAGKPQTIKGPVDDDDPLALHLQYRFLGDWSDYKGEDQFHFRSFVRCAPKGRAGVVAYLAKAPGIGPGIAAALWTAYQEDAVRMLREEHVQVACEIDRLTAKVAEQASRWLWDESALEGCMVDLLELLDGRGFPKTVYKRAIKSWGNKAADVIKGDPAVLLNFRGCGYKKCHKLYLDLGGDPKAIKWQALACWYAIQSSSRGDTWHYGMVAKQALLDAIGEASQFDEALRIASDEGLLSRAWTDGLKGPVDTLNGDTLWVAVHEDAINETVVAKDAYRVWSDDRSNAWPSVSLDGDLSSHQAEQLSRATERPIGILTGGPGTGKSFSTSALIKQCAERVGYEHIGVCGPTGKSAVRLTEIMRGHGIQLTAKTIHSTLGVLTADDGGWDFKHTRTNPLPYKYMFIDEFSMVDTSIAAHLLSALNPHCHILLIGDVNQLLPVGRGAPLRDFLAARIPTGELTEIRRNEGGIVQACKDIREGNPFQCEGNLILAPETSPQGQLDRVMQILEQEHLKGLDPVWDCQVIISVNEVSPLSRVKVNEVLQKFLNKNYDPEAAKKTIGNFCVDDKIVCGKNGQYDSLIPTKDRKPQRVYVANGDLGRVIEVHKKYIVVSLPNPERLIRVPLMKTEAGDGAKGSNWGLAYAVSCWKSQGSEWPVVVPLIDEYAGAKRLCKREYWYTAISRAQERCYIVGNHNTVLNACRTTTIHQRKTFLTDKLRDMMTARLTA